MPILPLLCFLIAFLFSESHAGNLAQARNARLGRGVNMGNYLDADPVEGAWSNGRLIQAADFTALRGRGFQSVRIPVRWASHADSTSATAPWPIDAVYMDRVDSVVTWALRARLAVVLDVHHYLRLWPDPSLQKNRLKDLWRQIDLRFDDPVRFPDSLLIYELVNEPNGITAANLKSFTDEMVTYLRGLSPRRTIMIGGPQWSGVAGLAGFNPPADTNLIVTIHNYEPFQFTHQGASWEPGASAWLGTLWGSPADSATLEGLFSTAAAWGATWNVPMNLGEYGAIRYADRSSRVRWVGANTRMAERRSMSHHLWMFSGEFGFFDDANSTWDENLQRASLDGHVPVGFLGSCAKDSIVVGRFDTAATDSATVNLLYGAKAYANAQSSLALSDTLGALRLRTTLVSGPTAYSANAGLIVPVRTNWSFLDLRRATALRFRIRGNQNVNVNVSLGSPAFSLGDAGVALTKSLAVTTSWQTVTIDPSEMDYLAWMYSQYPEGTSSRWISDSTVPNFGSDSLNVAKNVKHVAFGIDPTWSGLGFNWTKPIGNTELFVDDMVILGAFEQTCWIGDTIPGGVAGTIEVTRPIGVFQLPSDFPDSTIDLNRHYAINSGGLDFAIDAGSLFQAGIEDSGTLRISSLPGRFGVQRRVLRVRSRADSTIARFDTLVFHVHEPRLACSGPDSVVLGRFEESFADSAEVRQYYTTYLYSNGPTQTTLRTDSGALRLDATLASDGTPFSGFAGFGIAINRAGSEVDFSKARSIRFRVRGNQAFYGYLTPVSRAYPHYESGVSRRMRFPVTTSWTTVTVNLPVDLEYEPWMLDEVRFPGGADAFWERDTNALSFSDDLNAARRVHAFNIEISPTWSANGLAITSPAGPAVLQVDDLVVVGLDRRSDSVCGGELLPVPVARTLRPVLTVVQAIADSSMDVRGLFTSSVPLAFSLEGGSRSRQILSGNVLTALSSSLVATRDTVTITARVAGDSTRKASIKVVCVVLPGNFPPVVTPSPNLVRLEDAAETTLSLAKVFADHDDSLSYTATSRRGKLSLSISAKNLLLRPFADSNGVDTVILSATEIRSGGRTARDTFVVTVAPVNDVPTVPTPFADLHVGRNFDTLRIPLRGRFTSPDGPLVYAHRAIFGLANTMLSGDTLKIASRPGIVGLDTIAIRATETGSTDNVRTTFLLRIARPDTLRTDSTWLMSKTPSLNWNLTRDPDAGWVRPYVIGVGNLDVSVEGIVPPGPCTSISAHSIGVGGSAYFRKRITIDVVPSKAVFCLTADDQFNFWVNGTNVRNDPTPTAGPVYCTDIAPSLRVGENMIAVYNLDNGGFSGICGLMEIVGLANSAPVVTPNPNLVRLEDAADTTLSLAKVFADSDDSLTYTATSRRGKLTLSISAKNLLLHQLADTNGVDTVILSATELRSGGRTVRDTFVVTITPVNDIPTLVTPFANLQVAPNFDTLRIPLRGRFKSPDGPLVFTHRAIFGLANTVLSGDTLKIVSRPGITGLDTIVVRATESGNANDFLRASFLLHIEVVNAAPVVTPNPNLVRLEDAADTTLSLAKVFSDSDDSLTYTATSRRGKLTLSISAKNLLLHQLADTNGVDTVILSATELRSGGRTVRDTFVVTITPVNDIPTLVTPFANLQVAPNFDTLRIPLRGRFKSPDGPLVFTHRAIFGLANTVLSGDTLKIASSPGITGLDTIVVRATESGNANDFLRASFLLRIEVVNSAPVVTPNPNLVRLEDAADTTLSLAKVFADSDDSLSYTATSRRGKLTLSISAKNLLLHQLADTNGVDTVILSATELRSGGRTVRDTFVVTLTSVNDVPTVVTPFGNLQAAPNFDTLRIPLRGRFKSPDGPLVFTHRAIFGLANTVLSGDTLKIASRPGITGLDTIAIRATESGSSDNVRTTFLLRINGDSGVFLDARDGRSYKWIRVGSQNWMAQNLNYGGVDSSLGVCQVGAPASCETYGRLYSWTEVMAGSGSSVAKPSGVRGVCPVGWHVPSDSEWMALEVEVGMSVSSASGWSWRGTSEGTELKASNPLWSVNSGTDLHGFAALPSGYGFSRTNLSGLGVSAGFWTASESDGSTAMYRALENVRSTIDRFAYSKGYVFALRCVKDTSYGSTPAPIVNAAPVVTPSPNLLRLEDATDTTLSLAKVFADSDDSLSYSATSRRGKVTLSISAKNLLLHQIADTNGVDTVILSATELGSSARTVRDTFVVSITPVNDIPTFTGTLTTLRIAPEFDTLLVFPLRWSFKSPDGPVVFTHRSILGLANTALSGVGDTLKISVGRGVTGVDTIAVRATETGNASDFVRVAFVLNILAPDTLGANGVPWNPMITYGSLTDARDGQTYRTVSIGAQTWMAQNINYAGSGVCFNGDTLNCAKYGRLYTFSQAIAVGVIQSNPSGTRGVCPEGWHLPSDFDWRQLRANVGGPSAGRNLKSAGEWGSAWNGADPYGFRGLPGGIRSQAGAFTDLGSNGPFWSATQAGPDALSHGLYGSSNALSSGYYAVESSLSVRCLRD